jgi:serum/glucocorticoid-regulated kinase 2
MLGAFLEDEVRFIIA